MSPVLIGYYLYTSGVDHSMDRKLNFYRINDRSIEARLSLRLGESWEEAVETVGEDRIWVGPESTTERIQKLAKKSLGEDVNPRPKDDWFPSLGLDDKRRYISQLQPEGPYRIDVTTVLSPETQHEHVEKIYFYNPH